VRYYDPSLRRFLQPDPSALDGVRNYAYAGDNPVDAADPPGLYPVSMTITLFRHAGPTNIAACRRYAAQPDRALIGLSLTMK